MTAGLRFRIGHTVLAWLLAAMVGMPLGAALVSHADPTPVVIASACAASEVALEEAEPEPVRFRFWIGSFEFSVAIGGQAGFMLAFEGLR